MEQYEILKRLAVGGMAELFVAVAPDGSNVVLKRGRAEADPRFDALLRTEAGYVLPLNHPNLVRALQLVEIEGRPVLVMELVEGVSVATLQTARRHRPLSPAMAAYVTAQVAAGLSYVHGQRPPLVHGDVTPANVLLARSGAVKLADFGIAEPAGTIRRGELRGNPTYLPPELLHGGPSDARGDLFQLGLLLAELLIGTPVLPEHPPHALAALERFNPKQLERPEHVPDAQWKLVQKLLQPEPSKRLAHAHEVLEALREWSAPVGPPQVAALFRHALPAWRSPLDPDLTPAPMRPTTAPVAPPPPVEEAPRPPSRPVARIDSPTPSRTRPPPPPVESRATELTPPASPEDVTSHQLQRFEDKTPAALPFTAEPRPATPQPGVPMRKASPTPRLSSPTPRGLSPITDKLLGELEKPRTPAQPEAPDLAELAKQTGLMHLPDAEMAALPLPPELLARLPRAWAERLNVIPVAGNIGGLVVAMSEPEPKRLMSTLVSVTGCATVRGVLASSAAIRAAIERGYEAAGLKREPLLKL